MAKIMFCVSSMHAGGAERVAALLANQWVAEGHQVVLVPTFSGRGECVYPLDEKVQVKFLADLLNDKHASSGFKRLRALRTLIKEVQPTVVVSFLTRVNIATLLAGWGLNVPIIVSERTYPPRAPHGGFIEWLRAKLYPRASTVVMQTSKGLDWLQRVSPKSHGAAIPNPVAYPVPPAQPHVVPNDILPSGAQLIIAVGRLTPLKGFASLVDAFGELAQTHPNWVLGILGEGEQRTALEAKISHYGLQDRVFLPGQAGNVADWYERADLFVLSSEYEGFPNALVEAMAQGKAVVSMACDTGPQELINHQQNGYLVEPADGSAGLAEGMAQLMDDPELRLALAARASTIRDDLSVSKVSARWQTLWPAQD